MNINSPKTSDLTALLMSAHGPSAYSLGGLLWGGVVMNQSQGVLFSGQPSHVIYEYLTNCS